MKKYLNIKLLSKAFLFVIVGLLINCQKEDTFEEKTSTNPSFTYKVTSLNELTKLKPVISNVKKMTPKTTSFNRDLPDFVPLENIDESKVIQYIDSTGYSTYTFKIINEDNSSINFENLYLLETEQGYIGYILSYEPNEDWYFSDANISPEGNQIFNIEDYQGDITKYSFERELIWTTKAEYATNSTANRASLEVCTITTVELCDFGGTWHVRGPNCMGNLAYTQVESCTNVWFGNGGSGTSSGSNEGGNGNNDDGSSTGGGGSGTSTDCNTSGTSIVNDQPLAGVNNDCAPNEGTGVLPPIIEDDDCNTSMEDLKKIFPNASDSDMQTLATVINNYGKDFGINSKEKLQHFLSQAGHETGGFNNGIGSEESLYYTTKARLLTVFSPYFSETDTINKRKPDNYLQNSSLVANYVYCCRMGNGNEASGEGYKYRGRGVFQLTGKTNYTNFKTWYNDKYDPDKDFVSTPELIKNNDTIAILSALWFYKTNVIDKITIDSTTTVKVVTKKINGGSNGLTDREEKFTKAKDSIKCK